MRQQSRHKVQPQAFLPACGVSQNAWPANARSLETCFCRFAEHQRTGQGRPRNPGIKEVGRLFGLDIRCTNHAPVRRGLVSPPPCSRGKLPEGQPQVGVLAGSAGGMPLVCDGGKSTSASGERFSAAAGPSAASNTPPVVVLSWRKPGMSDEKKKKSRKPYALNEFRRSQSSRVRCREQSRSQL